MFGKQSYNREGEKKQEGGRRVRKCTLKYLFLHSMFIHKYSVPCFLFSFIMCRIVWEYTERCFIKSHLMIYWYAYNTTQFWFWNIVDTRYKHTYERTFRKMVWNMKWGFFLLNYDFFQGKLCKSWVCILNKKVQIKFCLFFSRKKKISFVRWKFNKIEMSCLVVLKQKTISLFL